MSHPVCMLSLVTNEATTTISCDDCVMRNTDACGDCIVTFICDREPGDAVIIDAGEHRALRLLAGGGLVPELRHRREAG